MRHFRDRGALSEGTRSRGTGSLASDESPLARLQSLSSQRIYMPRPLFINLKGQLRHDTCPLNLPEPHALQRNEHRARLSSSITGCQARIPFSLRHQNTEITQSRVTFSTTSNYPAPSSNSPQSPPSQIPFASSRRRQNPKSSTVDDGPSGLALA